MKRYDWDGYIFYDYKDDTPINGRLVCTRLNFHYEEQERLQQELEKYRWRDVKEELPEVGQICIIRYIEPQLDDEPIIEANYKYLPDDNWGWDFCDPWDNGPFSRVVTHWMPMPSFDEQEKER